MDNNTFKVIDESIGELEQAIGAPNAFFGSLLHEKDDWTFVVKIHTLLESAVTHQLVTALKRPELRKFIGRLDMSSDVGSKLALAKSLDVLRSEDRSLIRCLSRVRNHIVHNVSSHPFNLEGYIKQWSKQHRDEYISIVSRNWDDPVEIMDRKVDRAVFLMENPRIGFWFRTMSILFGIYLDHAVAEIELRRLALAQELQRHP